MDNISKELELVKTTIQNGISEILPDSSISKFIFGSGKYIRTTIALLYFKALGCNIENSIYRILAAGELMHNASLLHDDVIDNAKQRRNNTTIAQKYSSKISILAGDYILSLVFEKLSTLDSTIINNFKDCAQQMTEAEIKQFFLRGNIPDKNNYLSICEGKTASLFKTILKSCARELNQDENLAETFGKYFGICFQIKNDLSPDSADADLENGIYTAKNILGIEKTLLLLDNYKEKMRNIIKDFPSNTYKKALEDLIIDLCTIEKLKADLKETVDTIVFVIIAVILIRFFIAELRWIPSGSMKPTLVEGDRIVVEKITKFPNILKNHAFENDPKRGDVMIFYPPFVKLKTNPLDVFSRLTGFFCKDVAYIKRVIGLPGEKFEIKHFPDGRSYVYINDKRLDEEYIMSEYDYHKCRENMYCGPFIIPENQYFMMGDNRGNSQDSRFWGTLPKERFIGRAVFTFWPLNHLGILE